MSTSEIQNKPAGRILRVKEGYNPNSSSMGSMILILPTSLLAITVGFGAVSAIIMSAVLKPEDTEPEQMNKADSPDGKHE